MLVLIFDIEIEDLVENFTTGGLANTSARNGVEAVTMY